MMGFSTDRSTHHLAGAVSRVVLPYMLFVLLWFAVSAAWMPQVFRDNISGCVLYCTLFFVATTLLLVERTRREWRKQAAQRDALQQSEARLRLLVDNLPDSYVYQYTQLPDGTPKFFYISAGVERLHAIKVEEVLNNAAMLLEQISAEMLACLRAAEISSRQSFTDFSMEVQVRTSDDRQRWMMLCSRPQRTADDRVLWNGVATDITERKQVEIKHQLAEQALRESEQKYRELVQLANSIILRWNAEGIITFMNEYGLRFFGYTADELCNRHVIGTIVPYTESGGRDLRDLMERICADPRAFEQNINENTRRNGERVWISWTNKVVLDAQGKVLEILSIGTDITRRKQAEEQVTKLHDDLRRHAEELEHRVDERTAELAIERDRAEAADRLKSAFLATMSHELRTPLNSIIGFTGILLQGLAGPLNDEQHKQLGMVRSSARHLLELINDVLDISKIEAGQLEVACETFNLHESIVRTVNLVRPLAEQKGLELQIEYDSPVDDFISDQRRVEQILINLLNNAVKFTEHGGVRIVTTRTSDALYIAVTDTGIGIKQEDLGALFRPFQQIDSGLTRAHEGTGLGLAICRRLAELLHGHIEVSSTWGKGSTFTIVLPCAKEKE